MTPKEQTIRDEKKEEEREKARLQEAKDMDKERKDMLDMLTRFKLCKNDG